MATDENETENNSPVAPDILDFSKYSNLYLGACESGHVELLKFLFAEELFGKQTILKTMNKWFCFDLCGLVWSFLHVPLDVNTTNFRGMTGLSQAAKNGHENVVQLLLQIPGIDVNLRCKSGMNPLLLATRRSQWNVVDLLLKEKTTDVNIRDESGWTSLMIASRKGKKVNKFLDRPEIDVNIADEEGLTALVLASKYGHPEAVDSLLYFEDLDLSLLTTNGQTQYESALLYAYDKKHTEIISILEIEDL
jgi:ankyrin repeat protein